MRIQAGQSIILAIDLQDRLLGTLPPRLALGVLP